MPSGTSAPAFPSRPGSSTAITAEGITDRHRNPACPVLLTRSRDRQKNGNRFVGRKNSAVVREYTGYDAWGEKPSGTASPPSAAP
jgi:hypothetical protein